MYLESHLSFQSRVEARHIIAVRELPVTRDTLLLRLLGRGSTFSGAITELAALPDDSWEKQVAIPPLVAFRLQIPQDSKDEEMQDFLRNFNPVYAEWEERVKREGERKGRLDGRREVQLAGERAVVLRQLTKRFGPLSEETQERVEQADLATLDRWAERLLSAQSLEEVFSDCAMT